MSNEISQYDSSFSTFNRINYWLYVAGNSYADDDYEKMYKSLSVLYKEAYPLAKRKSDTAANELSGAWKRARSVLETEHKRRMAHLTHTRDKVPYMPEFDVEDELTKFELKIRDILIPILVRQGEDSRSAMLG